MIFFALYRYSYYTSISVRHLRGNVSVLFSFIMDLRHIERILPEENNTEYEISSY
jgi:hypothetical protein